MTMTMEYFFLLTSINKGNENELKQSKLDVTETIIRN